MREQFEKLPEVHKKLKDLHPTIVWFCDQENKYASSFEGFQNMVIWLNGAYYAFQEQQKIINMQECGATEIRMILEDSEYDDSAKLERISELLE